MSPHSFQLSPRLWILDVFKSFIHITQIIMGFGEQWACQVLDRSRACEGREAPGTDGAGLGVVGAELL